MWQHQHFGRLVALLKSRKPCRSRSFLTSTFGPRVLVAPASTQAAPTPGRRRYYQELAYRQTGNPVEQLAYQSSGDPSFLPEPPMANEEEDMVLVQLQAAPVNPADLNVVEGKYPSPHKGSDNSSLVVPSKASYLLETDQASAYVGGAEGLGQVLEIRRGSNNHNNPVVTAGDTVVLGESGWGTWRSHIWVPARSLLKVPAHVLAHDTLSLAQVSLISQVAGTAYRLLQDFGGSLLLQSTEPDSAVVIQNAGTSAVSMCVAELLRIKYPHVHLVSTVRRSDNDDDNWSALVQLLTRNGTQTRHTVVSETTALAAADNHDTWRQWKKDHLPSPSAKVVLGLNSVHGPQTSRLFFPLLADHARLVTYGAMSKQSLPVPAAPLIFRDISVCGYWHSRWMVQNRMTDARQVMLDDLCQAVVEGDMRLPETTFVPLSQAGHGNHTLDKLLHPDISKLIRPKLVWNLQE